MKLPMDIEEIKKYLPHRYPFLLVDRIMDMKPMSVTGLKNVTANEHFFSGHFPGRPVMPGVLIVEALAQTAGVLMLSKDEYRGRLAFFAGIDNVKFRRTVVPGDQLVLEVEITKIKANFCFCKGVAKVGDELACSAEFMCGIVESK